MTRVSYSSFFLKNFGLDRGTPPTTILNLLKLFFFEFILMNVFFLFCAFNIWLITTIISNLFRFRLYGVITGSFKCG